MTKDDLIKLLESDKKIQGLIHKIAKKEFDFKDDEEREEEIQMLKELIDKWKKCFTDEKEKNQNLMQEKASKEEDLEQVIREKKALETKYTSQTVQLNKTTNEAKEISKKLEFYRENFHNELKIYEKYLSLQDKTKESLKNIFKGASLIDFISCGVQEKNIQNFWEYTKIEIIEDQNSDIDILVEMFYFFFARYSVAYDMYELLDTKVGDSFDTQNHIKHNNSKSNNEDISKIYLQGYKNIKTDKTIKQSIVKVG